jgi:4-amino-4-deoxy-L-arabinose transferase-like glycosyltransferase
MVETGDWLLPRFAGQPRLQKPPLFYWAGALSAELAGGHSLTTLRSVSALCGIALVIAAAVWGRSLGGYAGGAVTALAVVGTVLFWHRARTGDAEMLLALLALVSLGVFERLWRTRERRLLPLLAVLVGLAFLTKATAALLDIFVPIAVWLAWQRSLGLAVRPIVLVWALVALAVSLSWYIAIAVHVPGAFGLFRDFLVAPLGVQSGTDATHLRSPLYYLPRFPAITLPASLVSLWVAYEAWRSRLFRDEPRLRFIAASFLSLLAAWSVVPQKQIHYVLPLVPLQALLCGALIARRLPARLRD